MRVDFQPVGERDRKVERELNLANKQVIAFIGSFYAYEGLDLLVAAMPELLTARTRYPPVTRWRG